MPKDHSWIAARIPHKGDMCVLDRVETWNETTIECRAIGHLAAGNPLRCEDSLGIANGIEYAAQAMAAHGALLAGHDRCPAVGLLTSVRNVRWHKTRLDDLDGELIVRAERLSGTESTILYAFSLHHGDTLLMSGRASVMLDAGSRHFLV
ncbi:MAG: 3-hydroxylacyl-ACP dehydratase [Betaproteobacteria bacterium]|nr:3-hydroxylacyl-ACP dehydratase [Betaproteobacteria bacterium]